MKFHKKLSIVIMIIFLIKSVTGQSLGTTESFPQLKNIALISVKILPFDKPILPIIDAAAFNKKVKEHSEEIMEEEKMRVDKFRESLAESLSECFHSDIIYGAKLSEKENYKELFIHYNDSNLILTEDVNFPVKIISTGDIITITPIFGKNQNCKEMIKDICAKLEVDAVVFAYFYLSVFSPKINANPIYLSGSLDIADKEGELVTSGWASSESTKISGNDIGEYAAALDDYKKVNEEMVNKALKKYVKKHK